MEHTKVYGAQHIIEKEVNYVTSSIIALGDIVRETRKSKHMSQKLLADKVGVCKRTIIDIETNIGNPKFEVLFRLTRELDLPLYQIFYPDVPENFEEKAVLLHEVKECSADEIKMLLPLIRSLKDILRAEAKEKEEKKEAMEKKETEDKPMGDIVLKEIRV
ncbi:MAG: helix-turn-helix domain-containing protein [Lachnospiraceae bacterium]|nr:helix-turn-helix domain-containing protein [Lachnospiraceae bacterium]